MDPKCFNKYVQSVNKQQNRRGSLFQGRVKRKIISSRRYISEILFYIHLNPLKAGLVKKLNEWQYSNYHECCGIRESNLYDKDFIIERYICRNNYCHELQQVIEDKDLHVRVEEYLF